MSEQETVQVRFLSAEEIARLSPQDVLAYAAAFMDAQKAISGAVAEARAKQTTEAREALLAKLRSQLASYFPALDSGILKDVKDSGATAFVVVYDLETGIGTPSPTYATKRMVKKDGGERKYTQAAGARPLAADYEGCTSETERLEDEAIIQQRVNAARAAGSFQKEDGSFNESKARGAIQWNVRKTRCRQKHVAGY